MPEPIDEWEPIIQQIVDEIKASPKSIGTHRIFRTWRKKLEKEPPHLQPYQIDMILREVNGRLKKDDKLGTQ